MRIGDAWSVSDLGDSDGISLRQVSGATIEGCIVERTARAGIRLDGCDNGVVRSNIVRTFGGYRGDDGLSFGAGIQLSSNRNLVCSGNVISEGLGVGILSLLTAPEGSPIRLA